MLVAARALQGVSGALLTPAALAILIAVFPPAERGQAIGTWTAWGGIGILLGPLLGGQIVDSTSWRVVFAINVPIVLGTLALAARYVPEGGARRRAPRPHVDVRGAVLAALGLAGPTFALIQQPQYGWASPGVLGPLLGGLLALACSCATRRGPRSRCCRSGSSPGRTSAGGTSRRSRCTAASRSSASSSASSCSRSRATRR